MINRIFVCLVICTYAAMPIVAKRDNHSPGDCDYTEMYAHWIPCKPKGKPCPFNKFRNMVRGSSKSLCPSGCRCYDSSIYGSTEHGAGGSGSGADKPGPSKPGAGSGGQTGTENPRGTHGETTPTRGTGGDGSGSGTGNGFRDCDITKMFLHWVPCKPEGKPCSFNKFRYMIRGSSKSLCPTGCRCYDSSGYGGTEHGAGGSGSGANKPDTSEPGSGSRGGSGSGDDAGTRGGTRHTPCDLYRSVHNRGDTCMQKGNLTVYASLKSPDKLRPYFECSMPPINGKKLTVHSQYNKFKVIEIMKKFKIYQAWIAKGDYNDVEPRPCDPQKICVGSFKCGKCCRALDATGNWIQAPCDKSLPRLCVTKTGCYRDTC